MTLKIYPNAGFDDDDEKKNSFHISLIFKNNYKFNYKIDKI